MWYLLRHVPLAGKTPGRTAHRICSCPNLHVICCDNICCIRLQISPCYTWSLLSEPLIKWSHGWEVTVYTAAGYRQVFRLLDFLAVLQLFQEHVCRIGFVGGSQKPSGLCHSNNQKKMERGNLCCAAQKIIIIIIIFCPKTSFWCSAQIWLVSTVLAFWFIFHCSTGFCAGMNNKYILHTDDILLLFHLSGFEIFLS